jgi:hypothetical protein
MKSVIHSIALAAVVCLASVPALQAQTGWQTASVTVPFSFNYGKAHLGHGQYVLSISGNSLTIRGNRSVATALAQSSYNPSDNGTLRVVFARYGDRYFLEEVRGAMSELTVMESSAEKRAAREFAMRGERPEIVALAPVSRYARGN